ncbi:hypothetical protein ABK249_04750 [Neorhizobium sp. Rsf11]|uniref:Uncharacterized protein n=1 Tax=Neorhizobium phenanthreniclasticum TaxID=3157917 RepID=A0ABV0LXB3_9HYPH
MRGPLRRSSFGGDKASTYHIRSPIKGEGKRKTAFALALLFLTTGSNADAQISVIDGVYGDEGGCRFARTNEWEELFATLTDESVTTALSHCEFKGMAKPIVGGFRTEAVCDEEGEEQRHESVIDILRNGDVYTVRFADGLEWGPFTKCR